MEPAKSLCNRPGASEASLEPTMLAALKRNASSFLHRRKRLSIYSVSRQPSSIYNEPQPADPSPMSEGSRYGPLPHPLINRVFDSSSFVEESQISSLALNRPPSRESSAIPGTTTTAQENGSNAHARHQGEMPAAVEAGLRLHPVMYGGSERRALILSTPVFAQIRAMSRLYRELQQLESRIAAFWSECESLIAEQREFEHRNTMSLPGGFPAEMESDLVEEHQKRSSALARNVSFSTKALQDLRAQKAARGEELDHLQADIMELLGQALDAAGASELSDISFELGPCGTT